MQGSALTPGQSMFGDLRPNVGPSAEELETERQRVLFRKHVQIKTHCVKIFDMHEDQERKAYEKLMKKLIVGVQLKTHVLWANDKQLVTRNNEQRWLRYLEWSEFELDEHATAPVGVAEDAGE